MIRVKEGGLPSRAINLCDQSELPDVVMMDILQVAAGVSDDPYMITHSINPFQSRERYNQLPPLQEGLHNCGTILKVDGRQYRVQIKMAGVIYHHVVRGFPELLIVAFTGVVHEPWINLSFDMQLHLMGRGSGEWADLCLW